MVSISDEWLEKIDPYLERFRLHQKWVYIILLGVFGFNVFFSLEGPRLQEIKSKKQTLITTEHFLQEKVTQLQKREARHEASPVPSDEVLSRSGRQVFSASEFQEFSVSILPEIARHQNVRLQSIDFPSTASYTASIDRYPLQVTLEGSYRSLVHFFAEIDRQEKVLSLSSLSLARQSFPPAILRATLKMEAYVVKR